MACPVCKMERTHKMSCRPENRRDHEMYESDFGRSLNAMLSSLQIGIREGLQKSPRVVSIPSLETVEGAAFKERLESEVFWEVSDIDVWTAEIVAETVIRYLRGEDSDDD